MTKHGISHGAAVVICFISSELLIDVIKESVPVVYDFIDIFSSHIIHLLKIEYSAEKISVLFYAAVMAILWGAAFSFMHKDKKA